MKRNITVSLTMLLLCLLTTFPSYAGSWQQDNTGWWYQEDDGKFPTSQWKWIDANKDGIAECYYFGDNGYLLTNTTIDGSSVNGDGSWVVNNIVQVQQSEDNQNKNKEYINPLLIEDMKSTIVELRNKYGMESDPSYFEGQVYLGFKNSPFRLHDDMVGGWVPDDTYVFFAEPTGVTLSRVDNLDTYHIEESAKPNRMEVHPEKVFCNFNEWYKADEFVALLKKVGATNIKLLDKSYDYKVYYKNTGNTKDCVQHVTELRFVYDGVWFYLTGQKGKFNAKTVTYEDYVHIFNGMDERLENVFDESRYGKDQTSKFEIVGDPASYWTW